jgi:hypothetical protein
VGAEREEVYIRALHFMLALVTFTYIFTGASWLVPRSRS